MEFTSAYVIAAHLFLGTYLLAFGLLAFQSFHKFTQTLGALRKPQPQSSKTWHDWPLVTVQLPIFNERFVAARVIQACAQLDYPKDRLEIQVLDDSNDETLQIIDIAVEACKKRGIDISLHRRSNRAGFKAGSLELATPTAKGEFLLLFDADFVPEPNVLKRLLAYFDEPDVALVQARWEHMNLHESWLTKTQAVLLDAHFAVEQYVRHKRSHFWNFNGTAGLWRKSAIEQSGGWHSDTLTEDMDLSYRAQMLGWKFRYIQDIAVMSELPADINGFNSQQRRWAKGGGQTAQKLSGKFWRTKLGGWCKFEGLMHLFANHAYLLKLILIPLLPLYVLIRNDLGYHGVSPIEVIVLMVNFLSLMLYYSLPIFRFKRPRHFLLSYVPMAIFMETGISIQKAFAIVEGFYQKTFDWDRTPKLADTHDSLINQVSYVSRTQWPGVVELGFCAWLAIALVWLIVFDSVTYAAAFFIIFSMISFLLVGLLTIARERFIRQQLKNH
jgi:cellulose synthase/poly-beta-1,6-N-acetylglucosamine synthase-like glycosyltransferase